MKTVEIFKDIPNYKGLYKVSNLGRVKSLNRIIKKSDGSNHPVKERILKQCIDTQGYNNLTLIFKGNKKTFMVHQLVAIAFLNHKPNRYRLVVDHIDNDKSNNNKENLQLITQRENLLKNPRKNNKKDSSKYVGVGWHKLMKRWQSRICIRGVSKHLGYFDTELEAYKAYKEHLNNLNK